MRVLSFGGGVDSSAILAYHLLESDLGIDHVVFADTGAESKATYENIEYFRGLCAAKDLPFTVVAKDGENIVEWVTRLGIVPVMPGGSHVCSKKFKGDVIQKWVNENFAGQQITYLIGIEANEGHRTARFTKPAGDTNEYEYPLVDMGMDRDACLELLAKHDITVVKSSCVFCPFMSVEEIRDIRNNDKEAWDLIKTVEHRFSEESERKHQAWIDAGKPLNKGGRCNAGHWRKDSWAEGTRLFTKRVNGKQLSVEEWEALIDAETEEQDAAAATAATESVETPVAETVVEQATVALIKPYGEYKMTTLTLENAPARSAEEIKIFHAAFQSGPGTHVATWRPVEPMTDLIDGLEAAFRHTNNINGSWSRDSHIPDDGIMISNGDYRKNVEVVGGRRRECGLRSTSVGDAAEVVSYNLKAERIERCYFVCTMDGWEELSEMCFDAYLKAESQRKSMIWSRDDAVRIATGAVV